MAKWAPAVEEVQTRRMARLGAHIAGHRPRAAAAHSSAAGTRAGPPAPCDRRHTCIGSILRRNAAAPMKRRLHQRLFHVRCRRPNPILRRSRPPILGCGRPRRSPRQGRPPGGYPSRRCPRCFAPRRLRGPCLSDSRPGPGRRRRPERILPGSCRRRCRRGCWVPRGDTPRRRRGETRGGGRGRWPCGVPCAANKTALCGAKLRKGPFVPDEGWVRSPRVHATVPLPVYPRRPV